MNKEEEKPVHKVTFKKEPIWFKANFAGKYEGIIFRVNYREFYDKELEEVIRSYNFSWPGRIPNDKLFAEEGIKALFSARLGACTFDWKVTNSADFSSEVEKEELDKLVFKELEDKPTQTNIGKLVKKQEKEEFNEN